MNVHFPDDTIVRMVEVSRHFDEMQAERALLHVEFVLRLFTFYRRVGLFYVVYAPEEDAAWHSLS